MKKNAELQSCSSVSALGGGLVGRDFQTMLCHQLSALVKQEEGDWKQQRPSVDQLQSKQEHEQS